VQGRCEPARVALCGECAPLLWAQGKGEAAIRLEHLWDEIAKSHDLNVLCACPLGSFQGGIGSSVLKKSVQSTQPFIPSEKLSSRPLKKLL
jgi:hypothetical protein